MGLLVVLLVLGFFVGNFLAAKPKKQELKKEQVRYHAKRLGLNPAVVPMPHFLTAKRASTVRYTLVNDNWRLPQTFLLPQHLPAGCPKDMLPLIDGVCLQSNSVILYWQEGKFLGDPDTLLDFKRWLCELGNAKNALTKTP